jgi:hypothetical protein
VKSLRAPSLLLGVVLALSLSGKLLASRAEPAADEALFAESVATFLKRQGLVTRSERRPMGMMVVGERGDCRLTVREAEPHGTYANVLARMARRIGPLAYVYRGTVTRELPKIAPLADYFVGRELRRIHVPVPRAPILAVAAAPACNIMRWRWQELATLPR